MTITPPAPATTRSADNQSSRLIRIGGAASLLAAGTFAFGIAMFATTLADYTDPDATPAETVDFLVDHQGALLAWYIGIFIVFGAALVPLGLALRKRLVDEAPTLANVGVVFAAIWAALMYATGMISNIGIEAVANPGAACGPAPPDRTLRPDRRRAHRYGSWPAYGAGWGDNWGAEGGRIYATALNALTLEVFFRYLPLNELPADYDYSPVAEQILAAGGPTEQLALVAWLGQLRAQLAEPLLYRLAGADNPLLRLQAAIQLAGHGSPLARRLLTDQLNWAAPGDRLAAEQALAMLGDTPVPDVFGPVSQADARAGLACFEIADNWIGYGLPVAVVDDAGQPLVRMVVASFDRASRTAVAKMDKADKAGWAGVAPGQAVKLWWR